MGVCHKVSVVLSRLQILRDYSTNSVPGDHKFGLWQIMSLPMQWLLCHTLLLLLCVQQGLHFYESVMLEATWASEHECGIPAASDITSIHCCQQPAVHICIPYTFTMTANW